MHICVWFSIFQREMGVFVNGSRLGDNISYLEGQLTGGGDLILGQDQDDLNAGRLQSTQAFK